MSDCCSLPANEAARPDDRCRRCGARGRSVPRETMESLLRPEARARLAAAPYFFDRTADCPIVYFSNEADSSFTKDALRVRVGIKEVDAPRPLCYCFDHTAESIRAEIERTGRSTVAERIRGEIRAGRCRCEVTNPSGTCCLGDVTRFVRACEDELAARSLTPEERR